MRRLSESVHPDQGEVLLFADDSEQSQEARRMLEQANIPFRVVPAAGDLVPTAEVGDASFPTLDGIRLLIRGLPPINAGPD